MHIQEFQDMMRQLYYHKDSKRGAIGTYEWLLGEVEELGEALNSNDKEAIENEFADVIAWLASLANVVGISLECATIKKYNWRCPKCQQSPCRCPF
jgi:NTP pyrophosphatase (non-canonical NTP hydrolase)